MGRRHYAQEVKRAKRREKERNAAIKMQSLFRRHKGMIVYQQRPGRTLRPRRFRDDIEAFWDVA